MKKFIVSIFLVLLVAGVSGCMSQQPTKEEKKTSESAMLSYLDKKYDQNFSAINYIPAKRGFNDSMNLNILVAKSEDGILVNVRERLSKPGQFFDDYRNALASKSIKDKINYGSIENLHLAKTYITLTPEVEPEDVKNGVSSLAKDDVIMVFSIVSVSSDADEKTLKALYDVYQQLQSLGYPDTALIVAFSPDKDKAESYVNNFFLYGNQKWEEYDKSVKHVLKVNENGLSFDEFKNQLK
ncbi:hypothetical protein [Neobacillus drentensis]|jgi:hypothetical protein|uniref:hypothetical protein n=1 Tax=Neobacillus drentensis TaxID=220684 RepID=UPI003000E803